MATKEKAIGTSGASASAGGASLIPAELFQVGSYKSSQGRTVRSATAWILAVIIGLSAYRLHDTLRGGVAEWWAPGALLFVGWWLCYRLVHIPKFADFLIAVEAEMSKVSWPTKTELYRASIVVIAFIVSLAAILFAFDLIWQTLFRLLGVID